MGRQVFVIYPHPFESNCISYMKIACTTLVFGCLPCFIWDFVLVPHLLYRDLPLVQGGNSILLGSRVVIIWAQVCLTDACIAYLSPFCFSDDQFWHEMIMLLGDNATYHAVVG